PRHLHSFPTRRSSDLGRGRLPRAALGAGAELPLPDLEAPGAVAVRTAAKLVDASAARPRGSGHLRPPPPRPARLPCVHADRDGTDRKSTRLNSSHVSI